MCGIAGVFNPSSIPDDFRSVDRVKDMVVSLHHRGPDEKGVLVSDTALLGSARLSIIDLAHGSQPILSPDRKAAVIMNGEIFNYVELREELMADGIAFETTSDTEVVLALYRRYGRAMLDRMNGQFAFVVVDFAEGRIFGARDRIGIRPFFYTFVGETLLFASSIKALTVHPQVSRELNPQALEQVINLWTTWGDSTFVKNVHALPPGHFLEYSSSGCNTGPYWDLSFPAEQDRSKSSAEWCEIARTALQDATKLRLRSDVPVNSYLSGGIDSSIILKLLHDLDATGLETFSVQFTEEAFDESEFQEAMTRATGIPNNAVEVSPSMIGDVFEQVIYHAEQPVFRTAPAPLVYLSKLVNQGGYKVVLTGEGADEVAWGYNIYKETMIRRHLAQDPDDRQWLDRIAKLNAHLPQYNKRYEKFLIEFYRKSLDDPDDPLFSHRIRMSNGQYVRKFINQEFLEAMAQSEAMESVVGDLPSEFEGWNPLQKTQYLEMKTLLAGYLLSSQGDRTSMAHSVEGRYPFLDHEVVAMFAGMPDEMKLQIGPETMDEKHILKATWGTELPRKIIERPKYPYRAPEGLSLLHPAIEEKYLNQQICEKHGIFIWKYVDRLKEKVRQSPHKTAFVDNATLMIVTTSLMFLEMLEQNFDRSQMGGWASTTPDVQFREVIV